ncbi:MAG: cytochrome c [Bryobacteraceae bacterium]|nr:cytochrome c [Bryobacteraceae bacterium]
MGLKHLGIAASVCLGAAATGAAAFIALATPKSQPAAAVRVQPTPERIERGRYLFHQLADCAGCHSPRDPAKFAMIADPARTGAGFVFPDELGFPGRIVAPNITPDPGTGIGRWTDGEKIRAIREGISRDGRALFAFMPFRQFAKLSDEDIHSLVAYLNSLPPVRNALPRTALRFPVNILSRFEPEPVLAPPKPPGPADRVRYGELLAGMACIECHTELDNGRLVAGREFAGGHEFAVGAFVARSANLTPDVETGIGGWTEERFVRRFRDYGNLAYANAPRAVQANFTVMPWYGFAHMKEDDLRAIYAYLRSLRPVYNPVAHHPQLAVQSN